MKRRPPIALDALDHLLLMALRYALPRTISTGEPDREVIAAWTSQPPWLPSWALSQALEECAHVDRGDAACAGALCDSPTMRAAASDLGVQPSAKWLRNCSGAMYHANSSVAP